ncbi:unnamed protein product [Polarella glacialis]|uniref:SET domain-containing protein n=1 Tax=Polarella glacialis TaxID=89957 RepID=A0A813DRZ3_POLGL|nr:unnamed protein product [Polarella glacialis]
MSMAPPSVQEASTLLGEELSLQEVKQLVEKASASSQLEFDGDATTGLAGKGQKGRFLVARHPLKAGDVILSERPLFRGCMDGLQSRKAYVEAFTSKLDSKDGEGEEEADFEDDCLHPRSPLLDCVAGVILAKHQARDAEEEEQRAGAQLRLRQLGSLSRAAVDDPVPEGLAKDVLDVLKPELAALTSEEELRSIVHILGSNRFGNTDGQLDLMFTGSMFEHSCLPNCFVGTWRASDPYSSFSASGDGPRTYRVLRDVAEGEALSIDYLLLPGGYQPTALRAEILSRWGFSCTCPRCTCLPELERAFVCAACGAAELCPEQPRPALPPGASSPVEESRLLCRACGKEAEADYAIRCLEKEASLLRVRNGQETPEGSSSDQGEKVDEQADLLGQSHYLVFQVLWSEVASGPPDEDATTEELYAFRCALEAVIEGVARLYDNDHHPLLLDLYHLGAWVTTGYLEAQRSFLDHEHEIVCRYYPEEGTRHDAEIMALVQGKGPHAPSWAATGSEDNGVTLEEMD